MVHDRGVLLVNHTFATNRLEPREADGLWTAMRVVPPNCDPEHVESAFRAAGFAVADCVKLGTEWGEHAEESTGRGARRLLHAARLLRSPDRYIAQFGQDAYDIMLGDCLWHVYLMIGKLEGRVYLLRAP